MLSFAVFFLLLIYEEDLKRRGASYDICKHLLHREHHICFLKGDMLASFKVSRIQLHDLVLPSPHLEMPSKDPTQEQLIKDLNILAMHREDLFNQINEKLNKIKSETFGSGLSSSITSHLNEVGKDFENLKRFVDDIDANVRTGTQLNEMRISMLMLKVSLLKTIAKWKSKLATLGDIKKKEEKSAGTSISRHPSGSNLTSSVPPPLPLQHSACTVDLSSQSSIESQNIEITQGHVRVAAKLSTNASVLDGDLAVDNTQTSNTEEAKKLDDLNDTCIDVVNILHDTKFEEQQMQGASSAIAPPTAVVHPTPAQSVVAVTKTKWHSRDHSNCSPIDFQLLSPFPTTLHADLYLKPGVLVDENQPSSIIAYTLASSKLFLLYFQK